MAKGLHKEEVLSKEEGERLPGDYLRRQEEVKPSMRRTVAEWMMEVSEEEGAMPEVFCLAVNCLDRFLDVVEIKKSQLQLLACACLLVAWKVREHTKISAQKIIKYTNFNVTIEELLEWEVLLLAKLNWNIPSVVAIDFVEHILQSLEKLRLDWNPEMIRRSINDLILACHTCPQMARYPPSLVASACVVVTIRPIIEMPPPRLETPSPSSCSSSSSPESSLSSSSISRQFLSSSSISRQFRSPDKQLRSHALPDSPRPRSPGAHLERIVRSVQKITFVEKPLLQRAIDQIEDLQKNEPLPPSPSPEHSDISSQLEASSFSSSLFSPSSSILSSSSMLSPSSSLVISSPFSLSPRESSHGMRFSTSSPLPHAARTLFSDFDLQTPTKILDAAVSH